MSKQSDAKIKQGYTPKAIPHTCSNCRHCVPVMGEVSRYVDPHSYSSATHVVQSQISQKCALGGFAVKKMGTCNAFEFMSVPTT